MLLTDKQSLSALSRFATKNDARYYLNGVLVRDGKLTATNGHTLLEVYPLAHDLSEYPMPDAREPHELESLDETIIPIDIIQDAIKNAMPQKHLEILDSTILLRKLDKKECGLTSTDAKKTKSVAGEPIDGRYPDFSSVFESAFKQGAATVGIDPQYLIDMGTAMKGMGVKAVKVTVSDDSSPVGFEGHRPDDSVVRGLIMPTRI